MAKRWIFQEERGANEGRYHYQGKFHLAEKRTKQALLQIFSQYFDAATVQQLTLTPTSTNGQKTAAAELYCMKGETRTEGPWTDPSFTMPKRQKRYEMKDLACMEAMLGWQDEMWRELTGPADDRSVVWIWNADGNAGKSKFIKYMVAKSVLDPAFQHSVLNVPLGTATQIKTVVCKAGAKDIYLCDIGRVSGNQESQRDLFSALESIKNGMVQNVMYGAGDLLLMEPPHVVVFSNDLPNINLQSKDRWRIRRLDNKDSALHTMSLPEVAELLSQQAAAKDRRRQEREQRAAEAEAGPAEDVGGDEAVFDDADAFGDADDL